MPYVTQHGAYVEWREGPEHAHYPEQRGLSFYTFEEDGTPGGVAISIGWGNDPHPERQWSEIIYRRPIRFHPTGIEDGKLIVTVYLPLKN